MAQSEVVDPGRGGIQVIERAAAILRVLKGAPSGLSLGQIAAEVDLPRSTVQRIARALQAEGFLVPGPNGTRLRLGPGLAALAAAAHQTTMERCRRLLVDLADATGETADLSVLRGASMVFLDQVAGSQRLRTVSAVGEAFPLTNTANGKACLAALPRAEAEALVRAEWARGAQPADPDEFWRALALVRRTGLAHDIEEHAQGICAVGFAFADWTGDLHAISVPVPSTRFTDVRARVEDALRATRGAVETAMQGG